MVKYIKQKSIVYKVKKGIIILKLISKGRKANE